MKYFKSFLLIFICVNFCLAQEKLDVFDIARKGTVEQVKEVLKTNPNAFKTVNSDGFSPLTLACYKGNNEVAKLLIENGCDINQKSSMGTPLMAAVVKGNIEIVSLLLKKNAEVNVTDNNGTTALLYATMFKNKEIVSLLIKANANPDLKDNRGNSALDYAILSNDDKLIEILKTK
jgi:ankyrin repeat protein